jgi:RNA polymerase sigma-70 factor (ECF subfamily)
MGVDAGMDAMADERSSWLVRCVLPHEGALRSWLGRRCGFGLEIDDVLQETYARLIATASVEHVRNPRTYAFRTAASILLDQARRARIVGFTTGAEQTLARAPAPEPSPEARVIDRDECKRLARAVTALPDRARAVFQLRRFDGLSQRETARRLGIAESTVEKHMNHGRQLMAEAFARDG